jgi:hypothetical protein
MSVAPNVLANINVRYRGKSVYSHDELEEYLAWKRGEEVTPAILSLVLSKEDIKEINPPTSLLKVISSIDGESSYYVTATLRRTFQAIDDYLSEFPNADSFELPCTSNAIKLAIEGLYELHLLVDCIDCIRYLNPKRASYYLLYNPIGVPVSDLVGIANALTVRERRDMIRSRVHEEPLPEEGLTYDILAIVFEQNKATEEVTELLRDYPSYLVYYYIEYEEWDKLDKLFLTADFSDYNDEDEDNGENSYYYYQLVNMVSRSFIRSLSSPDLTWNQLRRILTVASIRDNLFDNMSLLVTLPHGIDRSRSLGDEMLANHLPLVIVKIIELNPNLNEREVTDVLTPMKTGYIISNGQLTFLSADRDFQAPAITSGRMNTR